MGSRGKLLRRLLAGSYDLSFREFLSLLEGFGFVLDRIKGSHHVFIHPATTELLSVQPRKDSKGKPYQIRQFLKLIEAYHLELDED